MSLTDLKALRPGDRVFCRLDRVVALAKVNTADEQSVELTWFDGSVSRIYFHHVRDGRENRHPLLFTGRAK